MKEPTPEGMQAARELLELKPHLFEGKDEELLLQYYAGSHAIFGDDRFRLMYGLRQPRNVVEEACRRQHIGEISWEEVAEVAESYYNRPADAPMFEAYYGDLERQVDALGRLFAGTYRRGERVRTGVTRHWDEDGVQAHFEAAQAQGTLAKEELATADAFVLEARLDRNLPPPEMGSFCGPCIGILVAQVVSQVVMLLEPSPDGQIRFGKLQSLYSVWKNGLFPHPTKMQTWIAQEHTADRSLLQKRKAESPPMKLSAGEVHLTAETCNVTARVSTVSAASIPSDKSTAGSSAKVKVACGSELALGIDGERVLGFAGVPELGERVKISGAAVLPLSGERWAAFFQLACSAKDGRTISRGDLLALLPGGGGPNPDYLKTIYSEFRAKLKGLIDAPTGWTNSLFLDDGRTIDLGFTVRALFDDACGHYTFGRAT